MSETLKTSNIKKAGRKLVKVQVADFVYQKIEKQVGEGNVTPLLKLFIDQFSKGEISLHLTFTGSKKEVKK